MMKKNIIIVILVLFVSSLLVFVSFLVGFSASNAFGKVIDVASDNDIIESIKAKGNLTGNIVILDKKIYEDECFVLYKNNDKSVALAIFYKSDRFSFNNNNNDYYLIAGASSSSKCGTYNFTESCGDDFKNLLVAFGESFYLIDREYEIASVSGETIIKILNEKEYFMDVYRTTDETNAFISAHYNYIENY